MHQANTKASKRALTVHQENTTENMVKLVANHVGLENTTTKQLKRLVQVVILENTTDNMVKLFAQIVILVNTKTKRDNICANRMYVYVMTDGQRPLLWEKYV